MMFKMNLSMIALLAGATLAQTSNAPVKPVVKQGMAPNTSSAPAKPASQTVSTAATKTSAKSLKKTTQPTKGKKSMSMAGKTAAPAKMKTHPAVAQPSVQRPAAVKTAGRRDPFVSPLRSQDDKMKQSSVCTTGARCLIIDQVELKGIVKTPEGMIAMVENASKKQYNLREKDPVWNGQVEKITGDSLIFRETVTDNLGKQTTREVVKRVTAPVI